MSDTRFYTLASVVEQWQIENALPGGWFPRGLAMVIRGLRELSLDSWADLKTALLDVTDRQTCILPSDFVDWTKVGAPYSQYAILLGTNDNLVLTDRKVGASHAGGMPDDFLPNGIDFANYSTMPFANYSGTGFNAYYNSSFVTKGSFKVNDHGSCKELLMDYDYTFKQIYLEYITDGFDPCGETRIHAYIYDYLIKYLDAWYEDKCNPQATESSIIRRNTDLAYAERKVRARNNNLDPKTLLNIVRANTSLAIKM